MSEKVPVFTKDFAVRDFALQELEGVRKSGLTRGKLIAFHSRYKYLLLAHSQPQYRQIGPFVASIHQWDSLEAWFIEYRKRLAQLLSCPPTRRNHTNALMHMQGYFRKQLTASQREALTTLIDQYRRGEQPLLAPVTLLKHYMLEFPDAYLIGQRYFDLCYGLQEHYDHPFGLVSRRLTHTG